MPTRKASRHDLDAGGDPKILGRKAERRERIWRQLGESEAARFPGADGRIPNFSGAEAAAERLRDTPEWRRAKTIKANPDAPQLPVRQKALEDGKVVYMAVPRLATEKPFFLLDPKRIDAPRKAASIQGAAKLAKPVDLREVRPVDLVVTGCVAVSEDGARIGKGAGFSDLEYAIACEAGLIGERTIVVTTAHESQVLRAGEIPVTEHDMRLDLIVTPKRVIRCTRPKGDRRLGRLVWTEPTAEKIAAIPILAKLQPKKR